MTISTVRIGKEMRVLAWPWCGLMALAAMFLLPLRYEPLTLSIGTAGFWIGLPLLATLTIGHEFQHRTISLLFAQPIDRIRIWREKWIVLLPAMASAAALYLWTTGVLTEPNGFPVRRGWQTGAIAIVWIVTATCTAPFWTLVGRSILNGFVLNLFQAFVMFCIAVSASSPEVLSTCLVAVTGYAFLMFWLGRRKFLNFEVAGGAASSELLMPGSGSVGRFSGLLRSRPGQPILNLVRKEVRLLWIIWVFVGVTVLGVLCLAALRFASGISISTIGVWVSAFVLTFALLAAILAGSLSMGEERTSGTQSWHRTLPVPSETQWLVKLLVVLFASFVALALPFAVGKLVVGQSFDLSINVGLSGHPVLSLFLLSSALGFVGFWCGCLIKGTIRAALLTIPALLLILAAVEVGLPVTQGLHRVLHDAGTLDPLILRFHPFPFVVSLPARSRFYGELLIGAVIVSSLLVAAVQSHRLFRREAHERILDVLRPLLTVAFSTVLFVAILGIHTAVLIRAFQLSVRAVAEANDAAGKLPPETIPAAANPRQFSVEDLSRIGSLSDGSRRVLRDATVFVYRSAWSDRHVTSVHFRNGLSCDMESMDQFHCEERSEK